MTPQEALLRYFRTGTAEEDRAFLDRAFVTHEQVADILAVEAGTMRVLVGSKGIGKSALLEWIAKVASRRSLPVLLLRPDNLDLSTVAASSDTGSLKRGFYHALVVSIAVELGRQLKGFLKGSAATLHAAAATADAKDPDYVSHVLAVLSAIAVPVTHIDGKALAKDLAGTATPDKLMRAISQHLLATGNLIFLMIDDTDQVIAPGDASQLNRIWALLLAVRRLANECPALRCIVSLRTEVWSRLESESAGQRDQTDHLREMVVSLRATDEHIQSIVLRRLHLARDDLNKHGDPWPIFFEGDNVRLPSSEELRPWPVFIVKSARERPRDAIQLVKTMVDCAKAEGRQKITDADADKGMKKYSSERVRDAADEFARECDSLKRIIETFARTEFEMEFETLRQHLRTVGSEFSLVL